MIYDSFCIPFLEIGDDRLGETEAFRVLMHSCSLLNPLLLFHIVSRFERQITLADCKMSKLIKEVPAILPNFYIAFTLQDSSRAPNHVEIEEIRNQTINFWTKQLAEEFSKPFLRLELQIEKSVFGERRDEDEVPGLGDEFNMYLEVSGQAIFNGKFRGLPAGDEVFRVMVAGDSMDYLVAFVRGIKSGNLFETALEVTARRVKPVTGSVGGTVVCPSFFVAFALDQEDPESKIPDGALPDAMVEEWKEKTHTAMERNLRKEWPDTFESFDLDTTLADKGNKKPDARFHIYVENEASVKFSSDPPCPEDVFRVLMKSASTDSTVYLLSLHDMEGTPFSCVTMVTIQLVGMEMPEPEELPPMDEKKEEEETGDEGKNEGEDDGEEASDYITMNLPIFLALVLNVEPPAETPSDEELLDFKDLMLRFFYTTVKKEYPQIKQMDLREKDTKFGAGVPEARFNMCVEYDARLQFKDDDEIPEKEAIQKMIMEVNLSSVLAHIKNLEPMCFKHTTEVSMRRKAREKEAAPIVPDAAFEAAVDAPPLLVLPPPIVEDEVEERVTMLPPPEKAEETAKTRSEKKKKKLLSDPLPPSLVVERSPVEVAALKEKKKERKEVSKKVPTKAVEKKQPALSLPHVPLTAEEETRTAVKLPDSKKDRNEKPKKAPMKKTEAKKPTASPSLPELEPEVVSLHSPEQPRVDKVKKSLPLEPPMSPQRKPKNRVQSSDIYCAMKLDNFTGPPTDEKMQEFLENTREYFKKQLMKTFPQRFVDLELSFAEKLYGVEDTKAKLGAEYYSGMNFFSEFVLTARFHETDSPSSPVKKVMGSRERTNITNGLPSPYELTSAIVRDFNVIKFLLEHVRIVSKSDFTSASTCLMQQRIEGRT